jgi:hypothetical protein
MIEYMPYWKELLQERRLSYEFLMMESVPVTTFRACLLLDIQEGKFKEVAKVLWNKPGVVAVDIVEGSPDVVAVWKRLSA